MEELSEIPDTKYQINFIVEVWESHILNSIKIKHLLRFFLTKEHWRNGIFLKEFLKENSDFTFFKLQLLRTKKNNITNNAFFYR